MRLPHTPVLCDRYPPGSNLHGENHWPLLRVLVAHDVYGPVMWPIWGPMHGQQAVSEQGLLEEAIDRLPDGSTVIGDANFGVFSVAWVAAQRRHPVLLRLTESRARRLAGENLRDGVDREMEWRPSRDDRRSSWPTGRCPVKGRLMVREVKPDNGGNAFLLALFTTLPSDQQEIFALYGQRWAIETDLRTLKTSLCLDQLTCTTPDMVAREIDMAIAAYNLVRGLIAHAAGQSGIPPRGYSFTKVRRIVETFTPLLAAATNRKTASRIFDQMMQYVQQARLPRRKRKRPSYPREVWKTRSHFPQP